MRNFSICVPTLNRPETLQACLRTLVAQSGDDYEIVVSDNQGPPENRQIVESLNRPDVIRYFRTPDRLPMRSNFEYCLERSEGRYVTILGDDDGFCLGALDIARQLLSQASPELMFWFPHLYWWPNALVPHKQWMLYVYANPNAAKWVDSREYVKSFFAEGASPWLFERLPSIYNAFVSRSVIDRLKVRTGQYFCDEIPDVYSGIANALTAQNAVLVERPLTIRGLSGKSNGVALRNKNEGAALREAFLKEVQSPLCEPELIEANNLSVYIASVKLRAIRRFAELAHYKVSIPDVVRGILTELNEDADRSDDLIAEARALAEKYGLDGSQFSVPARQTTPHAKRVGVTVGENGRAVLAVDGEPLDIRDIYQASRCVQSLLGA